MTTTHDNYISGTAVDMCMLAYMIIFVGSQYGSVCIYKNTFHRFQVCPQVPLQLGAFSLRSKCQTKVKKTKTKKMLQRCDTSLQTCLTYWISQLLNDCVFATQTMTLGCTHILFVEIDHSLLKSSIFGLISFAKLLKNLTSQKWQP